MKRVGAQTCAVALEVEQGDLVSLVGGGGKTTLMYRLTGELRNAGLRAAAATTTKILPPGPNQPARLVCADTYEGIHARLAPWGKELAVLGRCLLPSGKVDGIPPEWCDALLREGRVDALVVEADGAARKPLKAPETWEPVVPHGTSLFVVVTGLSCLGKPLDETTVFRPERVTALTGCPVGSPLNPEVLVRLLQSEQGLLKGRPPTARAAVFFNQADVHGTLDPARQMARQLLEQPGPFERVVIAALRLDLPVREVWTR